MVLQTTPADFSYIHDHNTPGLTQETCYPYKATGIVNSRNTGEGYLTLKPGRMVLGRFSETVTGPGDYLTGKTQMSRYLIDLDDTILAAGNETEVGIVILDHSQPIYTTRASAFYDPVANDGPIEYDVGEVLPLQQRGKILAEFLDDVTDQTGPELAYQVYYIDQSDKTNFGKLTVNSVEPGAVASTIVALRSKIFQNRAGQYLAYVEVNF